MPPSRPLPSADLSWAPRRSTRLLLATALIVAVVPIVGVGTAAAAKPKCFGAAARDAKRPCFNPSRSFTPSLAKADLTSASPCRMTDEEPEPVCAFGVSASKARKHVALIGDSHALQWRGPLDYVARSQRWRGYSVTAPGCPFSAAVRYLPEGMRESCESWYAGVQKWIRRHPEVTTIYVSQIAAIPLALPAGKTEFEVKSAGYRKAWSSLPRTVKRVIAIHDPPMTTRETRRCLRDALAARARRPGVTCRVPRGNVLVEDDAVRTAKRLRSKRYAFADFTRFFCNSRFCYPVIGGALVYRDTFGHITLSYADSLGPYLLRRVRFLGETARRAR